MTVQVLVVLILLHQLQFLTQQKWATAYEKNQGGQNTLVIQNTQGSPALTIPPPAAANGAKGDE